MNLLNNIEAIFSTLSRQERKVALKVLQNPQEVQSMNITKLAKKAGVSNATITRFVRRMECSDFHDFKLKLAVSAASSPEVPVSSENNSMGDKVYEFYQKVLQGTWKQLDTDTIHNIVHAITKARRVYVYGLGSSGYTAQEFTQRLIRMGIAAFCTVDSHMMFIDSTIVNSDDVIIAISQSGNTDDVNVACSLAKQKGTKIISITGFYQSPLIELSTWSVVVKNSNFVDNTRFINSQLAIVYVIDIITMELMEKNEYNSTMNKTIELIMDRKLSK